MKEYKGSPALGDAGLLASAQAVEHYEIPATGLWNLLWSTPRAMASAVV